MTSRRLLLALAAWLLVLTQAANPAPASAQGERLVLAFYYGWFDMSFWQKDISDQPVQPYTSVDPASTERHVAWARQAGIDGFVMSWYGPQVENNQTEPNFATLLDVAAGQGFAAAVDFELVSPFFRSEQDVIDALQYLLSVHAQHPGYLRVGGRPVIFFWRQGRYSLDWWYAVRDQVDPNHATIWIAEGVDLSYLGPFDGNHLYSVAWDAQPEAVLNRWGARIRDWSAANGAFRYWVATAMPGYDDLNTGRTDAFVRERAGGDYYRRCWQGANESGADWVIITSFNEWEEGTQIEPSVTYGDAYINLTRELTDAFRAGQPVPPPAELAAQPPPSDTPEPLATDEPSPTVAPTELPSPTWTPSPVPSLTPTPVLRPSRTPQPSPTRTPTGTPTQTRMPTAIFSQTPSPPPPFTGRVVRSAQANTGLLLGGVGLALVGAAVLLARRQGNR